MTISITMTEAAKDYIKKMIANKKGIGFRLSVKKTGCSGFTYQPAIITEMHPHDKKVEIETNLVLFIDPLWAKVINGLHLDYIEDNKLGLKQKRLIYINPNETDRCGCGESFHIA